MRRLSYEAGLRSLATMLVGEDGYGQTTPCTDRSRSGSPRASRLGPDGLPVVCIGWAIQINRCRQLTLRTRTALLRAEVTGVGRRRPAATGTDTTPATRGSSRVRRS